MARIELVDEKTAESVPSPPPGEAPKQVPAAASASREGTARPTARLSKAGIRAGFFDKPSSAGRQGAVGSKGVEATARTSTVSSAPADSSRVSRSSSRKSEQGTALQSAVPKPQQRSHAAASVEDVRVLEEAGVAVSATEEKERGNDLYRKGRFEEAARCYSHSLALEPTAAAFANRAMVFLKLGRYEEAERDCTEALERDDEYVKALSRRATARLKLRRPLGALQDVCAALELEPGSRDLLQLKADIEKAALCHTPSATGAVASANSESVEPLEAKARNSSEGITAVQSTGPRRVEDRPSAGAEAATKLGSSDSPMETQFAQRSTGAAEVVVQAKGSLADLGLGTRHTPLPSPGAEQDRTSGEATANALPSADLLVPSTSNLVARSLELLEHRRVDGQPVLSTADTDGKAMPGSVGFTLRRPPKSAYEFETEWRSLQQMEEAELHAKRESGLSMERKVQFLKCMPAEALPALLKDSLSGPLLMDMLRTVLLSLNGPAVPQPASSGREHLDWAVAFLVALGRTPRYQIASLCLTRSMRTEVQQLWERAFGQGRMDGAPAKITSSLALVAKSLQISPD